MDSSVDTQHALFQLSHPLESNAIILGELKTISTLLYNSLNAFKLKSFKNLEICEIGKTIYRVKVNIQSLDVANVYESNMSKHTYSRKPWVLLNPQNKYLV